MSLSSVPAVGSFRILHAGHILIICHVPSASLALKTMFALLLLSELDSLLKISTLGTIEKVMILFKTACCRLLSEAWDHTDM